MVNTRVISMTALLLLTVIGWTLKLVVGNRYVAPGRLVESVLVICIATAAVVVGVPA